MSEFTGKKLKEARVKKGLSQDEAANLMNVAKRAISEMEAGKRSISADELAQFSRIYNVDVRELLFVEFTEAGDEQRLTAKYSSFLKLLEKLSDREVEDVYWVIKRKVEGLANIVCWLLGAFFVIGGICSFINGSASLGWQGLIVGIIVAVVPQALTLWGAEGIGCLKELLARI